MTSEEARVTISSNEPYCDGFRIQTTLKFFGPKVPPPNQSAQQAMFRLKMQRTDAEGGVLLDDGSFDVELHVQIVEDEPPSDQVTG